MNGLRISSPGVGSDVDFTDEEAEEDEENKGPTFKDLINSKI